MTEPIKVIKQLMAGKYAVLFYDEEPVPNYTKVVVGGKEYKPEIVYDLRGCIAIEATGDFVGETIQFV